ncbi:MAG: hypothetical protein VKS61_08100 [Candidatus Sericytochromatia bacterium]|nr:hypothetical protein [Candidatus Sericytochromatia bacterium]
MFKRSLPHRTAAAGLVSLTLLLSGCGTAGVLGAATRTPGTAFDAEATKSLTKGLSRVHEALFARLDKDSNRAIDEYEAGPTMSMDDFRKADKNRNNKLTFTEFKTYAITNMFFFRDTPAAFANRLRSGLSRAFSRLDVSPRDGLLVKNETSNRDMARLGLTFEYPRLGVTVKLTKVSAEAFGAADKTGDGKLGQAEFEDLYIELVVEALGGTPGGGTPPAPPAPPAPEDPAAPPAPPAEDPAGAPPAPPAQPAPPSTPGRRR